MINFLAHTDADRHAMLTSLGLSHMDELFAQVPPALRQRPTFTHLPAQGLSELELDARFTAQADHNRGSRMISFLGGGAYHRYIPAVVQTLSGRSEFYTAYTPYQPEVSQGTLQVIYEFQTMMAELTGMPVANAAVYDGANAITEAVLMARRLQPKRSVICLHSAVHPHARQTTATYTHALDDTRIETITHPDELLSVDPSKVACVVVQSPSYHGQILDIESWGTACKSAGAMLIVSADPISLGVLQPPTQADIVVGDLQPLGNALCFGGPSAGYMATQNRYVRQLPGRLVSRTRDRQGKTAYCLTLQTREQHIRREKATSNICTSQALNVLKATIMLSLLGPQGLAQLATLSAQRAHYLADRLSRLPGVSVWPGCQPFLHEFVISLPKPVEPVLAGMADADILAGIPLAETERVPANSILVCVTELNTPAQLAQYEAVLSQLL